MLRRCLTRLGFSTHRRRTMLLVLLCSTLAVFLLFRQTGEDVPDYSSNDLPDFRQEEDHRRLIQPLGKDMAKSRVQLERHITLQDGCRKLTNSQWPATWPHMKEVPKLASSPIVSRKTNVLFCLVGKVASSFFTRWVLTMNESGPMKSPYLIPIEKAGRNRAESLNSFKTTSDKIKFLDSSIKVAFGRDPFSRIFSAYIDKLFSPNPFYWKYWGEEALKAAKQPVTQCGSQVTFPQFVKLVTSSLVIKDVHLKQVADECSMCQMYYDVIGNLETTVADLDYASEVLNISSLFQHKEGYKRAALEDIVLDSLKSAFSWRRDIAKCISLDQMGLRIWRKLQIRGVIDSAIQYPFRTGQIEKMNVDSFISTCKNAIAQSTNRKKLKMQKKLSMEEAYTLLSSQEIDLILKAYQLDFELFGYSKQPEFLSNEYRKRFNRTNFLAWDRPWNIH